MIERLEMHEAPNQHIFMQILEEVREQFTYAPSHPMVLASIEYYMNERIAREIAEGEFRPFFVTPSNRAAHFVKVRVFINKENPQMVNFAPLWVYEDEEG